MSQIKPPGGDGTTTMPLHQIYANNLQPRQAVPAKTTTPKPVSAKYTNRTDKDIINERFAAVEEFERGVTINKERAFLIIECIKVLLVVALSFGGGSWASGWATENVQYGTGLTRWSTVALIGLGPWIAYALAHFVKTGVFMAVEKKLAIFVVASILVEEGMTMHAMRDPDFAKWFMVDFAPISAVVLLACIALIGYLRSDLKAKRDLAEMKFTEEDLTAKNATESRILKAKEERRTRTIRKMVGAMGHGLETGFAAVFMVPVSLFYRIGSAWRKTVNAARNEQPPAKNKKTESSSKTWAARKR